MAAYKHSAIIQDDQKLFIKNFQSICRSHSPWAVWQDIICMMACSISNAVDRRPEHWQKREDEYMAAFKRCENFDTAAELLGIIVNALERNPAQDFLGAMFMNLELGNNWKGQFFTPYSVAHTMAEITIPDGIDDRLKEHGFVSISDPACGAGVTLVAAADVFQREIKINYQTDVLFVGQDVDRTAALMCYIQLSLLGCPGYICVGNTLTDPIVGPVLFPEEREGQEFWYTPMFFSDIWQMRRMVRSLPPMHTAVNRDHITDAGNMVTVKDRNQYFFFNFDDKEDLTWETHRQTQTL